MRFIPVLKIIAANTRAVVGSLALSRFLPSIQGVGFMARVAPRVRLPHPSTLGHWEFLEMTVHCSTGSGVTGRTLWISDPAQAFEMLCPVREETPRSDSWSSRKSDGIITLFLMFSVLILLRNTTEGCFIWEVLTFDSNHQEH